MGVLSLNSMTNHWLRLKIIQSSDRHSSVSLYKVIYEINPDLEKFVNILNSKVPNKNNHIYIYIYI